MVNIPALKTELLAGHPDTGPYDVDNEIAAQQLNEINRPAAATSDTLRTYFLLERKGQMSLNGRLEVIAESAVASDPLGDGISLTLVHICAAKTMVKILFPGSGFSLNFGDSRFDSLLNDLAGGVGCRCIGPADKTAIQAMSIGRQSRANELGLGRVRTGTVEEARR